MQTFGEKLRLAIEASGLPLDEIAHRTGFEAGELEALGQDDLAALPADGTISRKLRAFAALMGVEEEDVLEDYEAARDRTQPVAAPQQALPPREAFPLPPSEPARPAPFSPPPSQPASPAPSLPRGTRRSRTVWIGVGAVVLLLAAFVLLRGDGPGELNRVPGPDVDARTPDSAMTPPSAVSPAPPPPVASRAGTAATEPTGGTTAEEPAPSQAATIPSRTAGTGPRGDRTAGATAVRQPETGGTGATIASHGVGTGVQDHTLIGEAAEFPVGTTAWFFTDVRDAAGSTIQHVWLHQGREELRVPLRIGGDRWRTHSYKTLRPGSSGDWVVEARDGEGRVLARSVFRCLPS